MNNERVTKHILLVDNEPAWLEFGKAVLAEAGYAVGTAQSAFDAWELLEKNQFDLVLMDLKQADEEQRIFQQLAKIQSEKGHRVVVVFPTELTPGKVRLIFKLGAHDCVDKRYDKAGLLTLVEEQFAESPATVLIVEDEEDWRKRLIRYLAEEPYRVEAVNNYLSAIDMLRENPFDVVILDLRLVDEDDENFQGMQLLRLLRERGQNVVIVIVSAYGTVEHVREGFKVHNIFDYVPKQYFDPETYRQVVREAVRQRRGRLRDAESPGKAW